MALETLGAVGAVCQLAGQCIYVLEVVDKVRRSTETLKEYQTQLQGLRVLSEAIEQNPLLQTREIISHTQSILGIIQQHDDLTILLQKRRLYRVWAFLRVERRLLEHTKNIEILKSTLAISIQDQQCRILNNIDKRTQMTAMAHRFKQDYDDRAISESNLNFLKDDTRALEMQVARRRSPGESSSVPREAGYLAEKQPRKSTSGDSLRTLVGKCLELSSDSSVWVENTASAAVDQQNGSTVIGITKEGFIDAKKQVWVRNRKDGHGDQHNGFHVMSSDGGCVSTPQIRGATYHQNIHTSTQNGNNRNRGRASAKQHNGHLYEAGPEPGQWRRTRHKKSR